jgi:hypothetical protein
LIFILNISVAAPLSVLLPGFPIWLASEEPLRTMAVQRKEDVYASVSPGSRSLLGACVDAHGAAPVENMSTLHPALDEAGMLRQVPQ